MAARRRVARLSRWWGDRGGGRRLSRPARGNRGAWQYQAARGSRHYRGRERGRDQGHLSRARARDRQIARSADRAVAERRRRRQPARPRRAALVGDDEILGGADRRLGDEARSEEHTSELQSLMRISYAVFCLKKKTTHAPESIMILSTKQA